MARGLLRRPRILLVDVDTQYDLITRHEREESRLLRHFRRLFAWARCHRFPVASTALLCRPTDYHDNDCPPVCIEGTAGQQKLPQTLLAKRLLFGPENRLDLPRQLFNEYQQIIFEKRVPDPFTNPRADRLLSEVRMDEFVVFGLGRETAIKATVLGLIYRMKKVTLVIDAIDGAESNRPDGLALRQMEAKGAKLVTTQQLTGKSALVGAPHLVSITSSTPSS